MKEKIRKNQMKGKRKNIATRNLLYIIAGWNIGKSHNFEKNISKFWLLYMYLQQEIATYLEDIRTAMDQKCVLTLISVMHSRLQNSQN